MSVDFDSLTKQVNTHPDLLSDTDITNIRKIVDANPSLFELGWDQPGSQRRDSGVYFNKTHRSDGKSVPTEYAFLFKIPTEINQIQTFDGTIYTNTLFRYLEDTKAFWFDADDPTTPTSELYHFLDEPPLLSASITAFCQLASEVTGNADTSALKNLLEICDNILTERHDWGFSSVNISKKNRTIGLSLWKNWDPVDDVEMKNIIKATCGNGNSKAYTNTKAVADIIAGRFVTDFDAITTLHFEFSDKGLSKTIGYEIAPDTHAYAPTGTQPMDNYGRYTEKLNSHNRAVTKIIEDTTTATTWLPSSWKDQMASWEGCESIHSVFGDVVIWGTKEGTTTELQYGFSGPRGGAQPTNNERD